MTKEEVIKLRLEFERISNDLSKAKREREEFINSMREALGYHNSYSPTDGAVLKDLFTLLGEIVWIEEKYSK